MAATRKNLETPSDRFCDFFMSYIKMVYRFIIFVKMVCFFDAMVAEFFI